MKFVVAVFFTMLSIHIFKLYPMDQNNVSLSLQEAVTHSDSEKLTQILSASAPSAETVMPALVTAHNQRQEEATQLILSHAQNAGTFDKIITLAEGIFDSQGSNLALSLVKRLDDIALVAKFTATIEKKFTDLANATFKHNFHQQLALIRSIIDQTISTLKTSGDKKSATPQQTYWLSNIDEVRHSAVIQHYTAIQQKIENQEEVIVAYTGEKNVTVTKLLEQLQGNKHIKITDIKQISSGSVDVLCAPHSLYSQMELIFENAQKSLQNNNTESIKSSPLFKYFESLSERGIFIATLLSGPNIQDFTNLLLGKHELHLDASDLFDRPSVKIFNNLETFLRCLNIFKTDYERITGKTITCESSLTMSRIPLAKFCQGYVKQYPELNMLDTAQREKFIRLLSVFNVDTDIRCLAVTLQMSIEQRKASSKVRNFKPIDVKIETIAKDTSNEISLGQQNLYKQIQNLNGSELSMPYIKDADGAAQLEALKTVLGRKVLNFVEIGGGRGETNAVLKEVKDAGSTIRLLNVEPHEPFAKSYIEAHQIVGISDVHVMQKTAQQVTVSDVLGHFGGKKADVVFASHAFYFILGDLHKATQNQILPLNQHPLWKYLEMLRDDGVLVITLQSGAGARLFRNALLGNHGLNVPTTPVADETTALLSSFGNMETLLRAFDSFAERYKQQTGKDIVIKMHPAVANVPLGGFIIDKDTQTGGIVLHNPQGHDTDSGWLAPKMMDFYGNWKEQQLLATLTLEKAKSMQPDELKKLGLENPTEGMIVTKRTLATETELIFLHILPAFAPAMVNMQHPNITLEVRVQKNS